MILTQSKSTSNSRFLSNFLLSLKSSKKVLIFISILHLLGLPMLTSMTVLESNDQFNAHYDTTIALSIISVFCLIAAAFCGIFIALSNFSYLYKKSEVDMVYSLPIKRKTKFFGDYLSGLSVYLIPYVIACFIADMIILANQEYIPLNAMPLILQGEFAGFLGMLMLYTLSVLALCCCGTLFESIVSIILINIIMPSSILVTAGLLFTGLYGVPIIETALSAIGYSSPCGGAVYLLKELAYTDYSDYYTNSCINASTYSKWVLLFMLFTAAYFLLSVFLYKKRKAEDTSKPYVFKFLYYIIITVITMGISLLAKVETELIIPVILFAFIVYMIFEIITNRGFKKIYISLIKYVVTMLGILIFTLLASITHGFGVEGKTYSPSIISSVDVTYEGIDKYLGQRSGIGYDYQYWMEDSEFNSNNSVRYKDKEIIKIVTDVQKQAIDIYRSGKYDYYKHFSLGSGVYYYNDDTSSIDYPIYEIGIRFNLKTGGSTTRYYKLNFEQLKQLYVLDSTEELADKIKENIINYYPEGESIYNNDRYILTYTRLLGEYESQNDMSLTADEAKELKECYKQDYLEASYEDFTTSEILCYLNYDIPLRKCFKRTVSFIKNKGGLDLYASPYYMSNEEGLLYSPEGYKSWGRDDVTASFGIADESDEYSHRLNSEQTTQLIKCARSHYIEEADCYVLNINSYYYVIPYEYTDIAEKIYNESTNDIIEIFPQISDDEFEFSIE